LSKNTASRRYLTNIKFRKKKHIIMYYLTTVNWGLLFSKLILQSWVIFFCILI
jgi:hypothetical protein